MNSADSLDSLRRNMSDIVQESRGLKQQAQLQIEEFQAVINHSRMILSERSAPLPLRSPLVEDKHVPRGNPKAGTKLERVVGLHLKGVELSLDGKHFVDCTIENCVLQYSGTHIMLERTHFSGCSFKFGGAAALTASVMECFNLFGSQSPNFETVDEETAGPGRIN